MLAVFLGSLLVLALLFVIVAKQRPVDITPQQLGAGTTSSHLVKTFEPSERYDIWRFWMERIAEKPLTGVGFGRDLPQLVYADMKPGEWHALMFAHAHDVLLNYALQLGIVGLAAFLFLLGALLRRFWRLYRSPIEEASLIGICGITTVIRVLIYNYTRLWQPVLRLAELLGLEYQQPPESWLPPEELRNMLSLADFELVREDQHLVCPAGIPLLADLSNRYLGRLPFLDQLSLVFGLIARPAPARRSGARPANPTVSVVIPCRNAAGHIRPLAESLPDLPKGSEFLFVEGHSTDDTAAVIEQVVAERRELPLRFLRQPGKGKGDAVRFGFAQQASGWAAGYRDYAVQVPPSGCAPV